MKNSDDKSSGPYNLQLYPDVMTRAQVAEYLQVSASTLSRWARDGIGPRCIYLATSTPRYRRSDLEDYLN